MSFSLPSAPTATQQKPTRKRTKRTPKPKRSKSVESIPVEQSKSGPRLYRITHVRGGGIVVDEGFHRRLSEVGAFAVQITGLARFQIVGSLSGIVICQIQGNGRASFTSTNPVVDELLNRRARS